MSINNIQYRMLFNGGDEGEFVGWQRIICGGKPAFLAKGLTHWRDEPIESDDSEGIDLDNVPMSVRMAMSAKDQSQYNEYEREHGD